LSSNAGGHVALPYGLVSEGKHYVAYVAALGTSV